MDLLRSANGKGVSNGFPFINEKKQKKKGTKKKSPFFSFLKKAKSIQILALWLLSLFMLLRNSRFWII